MCRARGPKASWPGTSDRSWLCPEPAGKAVQLLTHVGGFPSGQVTLRFLASSWEVQPNLIFSPCPRPQRAHPQNSDRTWPAPTGRAVGQRAGPFQVVFDLPDRKLQSHFLHRSLSSRRLTDPGAAFPSKTPASLSLANPRAVTPLLTL